MNPEAVAVLIPIVIFGGFFSWLIVRTVSKAYTAKLQAGSGAAPALEARQGEVTTGLGELRREGAGLAERGGFAGGLLAKARGGEGGEMGPRGRRTAGAWSEFHR